MVQFVEMIKSGLATSRVQAWGVIRVGGSGDKHGAARTQTELKSVLYIYNPHHNEAVTIRDIIEIDSLVPISDKHTLTIKFLSQNDRKVKIVTVPFQKKYRLGDLLPIELWPRASQSERVIRINLSIDTGSETYQSQPTYAINLMWKKNQTARPSDRCYCPLPWNILRLGHLFASPCYTMIPGFRVPVHIKTDYDPWNGDTMVRLRETLVQGQHKYCSESCVNFAKDAPDVSRPNSIGDSYLFENDDDAYHAYKVSDVHLKSRPTVLAIDLGTACNNYCRFCSIHSTSNPFALRGHALELAKMYYPYARRAVFTGGEPLLYLDTIKEIVSGHVAQEGKMVKLMTNGILLEDNIEFLRKFPYLSLSINLNTPYRAEYERLHLTDSFSKIIRGIKLTRRERPGLITIIELKAIVMRSTYSQLREFSRFAVDLGANQVGFTTLRWNRHQKIKADEQLTQGDPVYDEAKAIVHEASEYLLRNGVKVVGSFLAG